MSEVPWPWIPGRIQYPSALRLTRMAAKLKTILEDPLSKGVAARWAYDYVHNVIKGRWPEAEETISKDPEWAYWYALNVIKGRWPEAEETISKDPRWAYSYALNVIKGRWPEGEQAISTDPYLACSYACNVIKGRWPEAEVLLCDVSLVKFDIVKKYVSEIDWASPLNDFPIPKRIMRALK